jgi:hypothetical protein
MYCDIAMLRCTARDVMRRQNRGHQQCLSYAYSEYPGVESPQALRPPSSSQWRSGSPQEHVLSWNAHRATWIISAGGGMPIGQLTGP